MKALKSILVVSLFLLISSLAYSQRNDKDVVYLKNGSIIKGYIMEMTPGGTIKIRTSDGSEFVYPMDDVLKTEKLSASKDDEVQADTPAKAKQHGYFMIFRVGPRINDIIDNKIDFNVGFINGYQVNEFLSLGVGIETTKYTFQYTAQRMTPVFMDVRFYVPKKRVKPMFSFQFGYALGSTTTAVGSYNQSYSYDFTPSPGKGGMFMSLGAGMKIPAGKIVSFIWDGGLSFQSFDGYSSSDMQYPESKTVPSLRLNIGVALNLSNSISSK